jgi:phosphonopyruvate decarboxylase
LKHLINYTVSHCTYIQAANEGDAVAVAAGSVLGGKKSATLMQNSGLTNALSPLTSLNYPFQIPLLGFVSLRGEEGISDAPQHELTGRKTQAMLEVADAHYAYLSRSTEEALAQLKAADQVVQNNGIFFFIIRKDTFSSVDLLPVRQRTGISEKRLENEEPGVLPSRFAVLRTISTFSSQDTLVLSCTGKTSRELFNIEDAANNFYMVGSMGCVSSIALGLALARPDKKVIALDGDGAVIMRLGSLTTNAFYAPNNLLHIVIDNGAYDSTGGQPTVSDNVDFPGLANACGYPAATGAHTLESLVGRLEQWVRTPRLTLLHVRVQKGAAPNLQRPSLPPYRIKERFMAFAAQGRR